MSEVVDKAYDLYPNIAVWLDHPELGPIIREAAEEGLSRQRLQAKVWETSWWADTTEKIREWEQLRNTDANEADRRVEMLAGNMWNRAITEFGVTEISRDDFEPLAERALRYGWTEVEQDRAIRRHAKFVDRSDAEKQFEAEQLLNPSELGARIRRNTATLHQLSQQMGLNLSSGVLHDLGVDYTRYGWNDAELRQQLVGRARWDDDTELTGEAAKIVQDISRTAGDYLVRLSDSSKRSWARSILAGTETIDGFREYAMSQAKSRFPTMEAAIDRGLSVQDYVEPYRQVAAQTLEMNPDQVDFFEDRFSVLLDGGESQKGERMPMTLAEAQRHMRGMDEYKGTEQARRSAEELSSAMIQTFGEVAI